MLATMKNEKGNTTHPLKFLMWIAITGIVMVFAGFSSAFIVKRSQANWISYNIPLAFYYSTAIIVISSVAIIMAKKTFEDRQMNRYSNWLAVTTIMGFVFLGLQYLGFKEMWEQGVTVNRNVSFSFLYVIVGMHALHIVGGLVALIVMYIQSKNRKRRIYSSVYISNMATYWHFVDILWIYLLIFLVVGR